MGQSPGCAARTVKYIANSPAKNISSLDSQMIVPTLTMLGRVSECAPPPSYVAVVTAASFHGVPGPTRRGWVRVRAGPGALSAFPPGPRKASAASYGGSPRAGSGGLSGQHGEGPSRAVTTGGGAPAPAPAGRPRHAGAALR